MRRAAARCPSSARTGPAPPARRTNRRPAQRPVGAQRQHCRVEAHRQPPRGPTGHGCASRQRRGGRSCTAVVTAQGRRVVCTGGPAEAAGSGPRAVSSRCTGRSSRPGRSRSPTTRLPGACSCRAARRSPRCQSSHGWGQQVRRSAAPTGSTPPAATAAATAAGRCHARRNRRSTARSGVTPRPGALGGWKNPPTGAGGFSTSSSCMGLASGLTSR